MKRKVWAIKEKGKIQLTEKIKLIIVNIFDRIPNSQNPEILI